MILARKMKKSKDFLRFSVCGSIFWTFCEIQTKFAEVAAQIVAKIAKNDDVILNFMKNSQNSWRKFAEIQCIEVWAVQKHVNLVDLATSFPTNIFLQKSASIQPRTSHLIFIILAASRDLIFTERLSPEEVHVSLQEDGYLENLLRRKDSFDLYFDLLDGPKPYVLDPEMRRT